MTKTKFVARKRELATLNALYKSDKFELPVIYGRRRIGKSTLIDYFAEGKPTIFFQAVESSASNNLMFLSQRIDEFKHNRSISYTSSYSDFRHAFLEINAIAERSEEKLIFVIDEYPYLAEAEKSMNSILQEIIDHVFKLNKNIMLILCGSSMSFMEKQVLGSKSPLYGRRTAQFKLLPFTFFETAEYLRGLSREDIMAYHGITGGIPQYLEYVDITSSLQNNIRSLFLEMGSPLLEEPENLLKQELRNPATYNSILLAISHGKSKYNEIASVIDVSSGAANTYLNNLISLGIVEKKTSIFDKKGRKPIYKIKDGLYRFWFRFIEGNVDRITRNRVEGLHAKIMEDLPGFLGYTFEEVVADWIWENKVLDFEPRKVASWWGSDPKEKREVEIDIVAPDDRNHVALVGECKWINPSKLEKEMVDNLVKYSPLIKEVQERKLYFFLKESTTWFDEYARGNGVEVIEFSSFF